MKKVWMKRIKKTQLHDIIFGGSSIEIKIDEGKSIKIEGTNRSDHLINIYIIEE
jgi:hypothetical protein